MSVEAEPHIHQSAAALSAAQMNRSTLFPVAPFSKIQHSTHLFCCSCLFPCVAMVTRSTCVSCKPRFFLFVVSCPSCPNSYPQCRNHAAPKTSAGTNENQIKQDQKPFIQPRAHICTYVHLQICRGRTCVATCKLLRTSHPVLMQPPPIQALEEKHSSGALILTNRKTGRFLPQQIDRSEG